MSDWVVGICQRERVATECLSDQGFRFYFPKYRERCGKVRALFGRYFFVSFTDAWKSLLGTRGVAGLIMSGEKPGMVSDQLIQSIKTSEVDGYVPVDNSRFKAGQKLKVGEGPFVDHVAIYEEMGRADREIVLLNFLGVMTRVELPAKALSPLD